MITNSSMVSCRGKGSVLSARCTTKMQQGAAYHNLFKCSMRIMTSRAYRGARQGSASHVLRTRAIGFELPGDTQSSKSVEKQAEDLTRLAASLLLYQQALGGKPAQAFLSLLLHLQKGSPLKLLEHYGELYKSLAAEGRTTWQDYLLDQIVRGAENPFAKAAAKGEPTAHLLQAVSHDLNVLQQLSLTERTLATWVKDTAYGVSDTWLAAASTLATPPAGTGEGAAGAQQEAAGWAPHQGPSWEGSAPAWLLPPLTTAQRAALMSDIAGQWRWSEAAGMLQGYHAAHGFGLVSMHSVLTWTGTSLQAQDVLKGMGSLHSSDLALPKSSVLLTALERLTAELQKTPADPTVPGPPPHHWCITADPVTRWQLTCTLLGMLSTVAAEGRGPAFRAVVVPAGQLSSLAELAWALSQHPRARFLVVLQSADGLPPSSLADLAAMLSGYGGFSWPVNATLVAGFSGEAPEALQPVLRNALKWGAAAQ